MVNARQLESITERFEGRFIVSPRHTSYHIDGRSSESSMQLGLVEEPREGCELYDAHQNTIVSELQF